MEARLFGLLTTGDPWKLPDLAARLGKSDSTVARLLDALGPARILTTGERRGRRYFGRREVGDVAERDIPIFQILPDGTSRTFGTLYPVGESAFCVEREGVDGVAEHHVDLPYYLNSLRPAGYLGRQIPDRHPALAVPSSITQWSGDDSLRYLIEWGHDGIGDFILGSNAFERYLLRVQAGPEAIPLRQRHAIYPQLAAQELAAGTGSSAAGEQPKFLATTEARGPVLVKFSPPLDQVVGRRVADLLILEHLSLQTLTQAGLPAAESELLESNNQLFLETKRFDRTQHGRRGLIPLGDLDAQFLGGAVGDNWPDMVTALIEKRALPPGVESTVRLLWAFGRLTANTDMHPWNLSFFADGSDIQGLAPAYDTSSMFYMPRDGHVLTREFRAPMPDAQDGAIWEAACQMATWVWERASQEKAISRAFRAVAHENVRVVFEAARMGQRLPR